MRRRCLFIVLCYAVTSAALAQTGKDNLLTNQFLKTNEYLVSPDRQHFAIMQSDGNFVVYRGGGPFNNLGYVWGSQKTGPGGQFFAIVQSDGNLVVYSGTGPADNHGYVWGTQATAPGGSFRLLLNDMGLLVEENLAGTQIWTNGVIDLNMRITPPTDGAVRWADGSVCGTECLKFFQRGGSTTLTAVPSPGSIFMRWGGACTGSAPTCFITANAPVAPITASFCGAGHSVLDGTCVTLTPWSGGGIAPGTKIAIRLRSAWVMYSGPFALPKYLRFDPATQFMDPVGESLTSASLFTVAAVEGSGQGTRFALQGPNGLYIVKRPKPNTAMDQLVASEPSLDNALLMYRNGYLGIDRISLSYTPARATWGQRGTVSEVMCMSLMKSGSNFYWQQGSRNLSPNCFDSADLDFFIVQ